MIHEVAGLLFTPWLYANDLAVRYTFCKGGGSPYSYPVLQNGFTQRFHTGYQDPTDRNNFAVESVPPVAG